MGVGTRCPVAYRGHARCFVLGAREAPTSRECTWSLLFAERRGLHTPSLSLRHGAAAQPASGPRVWSVVFLFVGRGAPPSARLCVESVWSSGRRTACSDTADLNRPVPPRIRT